MTPTRGTTATWRRFLPLVVLVAAMVLVFAMGWHKLLSFQTIGVNYDLLRSYIENHMLPAVLGFMLLYIAVVALSLPGGLVMTVSGGLLFGSIVGTLASVVGATIGAALLFQVARSSLGETLAGRAGPWLAKLRQGFQENAFSYLLFLRLVPAFPFVVVNLAPALLGVGFGTYVLATLIGILPGSFAFATAGAGLASVVTAQNVAYKACVARLPTGGPPCEFHIDSSQLVTRELLIAFVALSLVALLPVVLKKWSKRNAAA